MKSRTWIRIAAGLLAFFAAIHIVGDLTNSQPPGSEKVVEAMRSFHFDAMGSQRTPWDFFRGLGLLLSANLVILTVLTWQVSNLSEIDPIGVRPFLWTLLAANLLIAAVSWEYFFIAPTVISGLTAVCMLAAILSTRRRAPN